MLGAGGHEQEKQRRDSSRPQFGAEAVATHLGEPRQRSCHVSFAPDRWDPPTSASVLTKVCWAVYVLGSVGSRTQPECLRGSLRGPLGGVLRPRWDLARTSTLPRRRPEGRREVQCSGTWAFTCSFNSEALTSTCLRKIDAQI